jgi:hypothetical protein
MAVPYSFKMKFVPAARGDNAAITGLVATQSAFDPAFLSNKADLIDGKIPSSQIPPFNTLPGVPTFGTASAANIGGSTGNVLSLFGSVVDSNEILTTVKIGSDSFINPIASKTAFNKDFGVTSGKIYDAGALTTILNTKTSIDDENQSLTTTYSGSKIDSYVMTAIGGLKYAGLWNAFTNTPTLVDESGELASYYIVSVAGTTFIAGTSDWQIGDWIIRSRATPNDIWQKIDQSSSIQNIIQQLNSEVIVTDSGSNGTIICNVDGISKLNITSNSTILSNPSSTITYSLNKLELSGADINVGSIGGGDYFRHGTRLIDDTVNNITGTFSSSRITLLLSNKEATIPTGSTSQYFRGDKTFVTLSKLDVGLNNVDNTSDASKPISTLTQSALNTKELTIPTGSTSQYIRGDKTLNILDRVAVGLNNVDNTSDASKPISTLTQSALNTKEPTIATGSTSQYFRGDKTFVTLSKLDVGLNNVDNTSDASKPISTLTQSALNTKELTIPTGSTSQYIRGDKTLNILDRVAVGLNNVDNTSDASKPISTLTQSALNTKEPLLTTLNNTALTFFSGDRTFKSPYDQVLNTTNNVLFNNINCNGLLNVTNTTASTSKTSGAVVVAGGLGISGDIYSNFIKSTTGNIGTLENSTLNGSFINGLVTTTTVLNATAIASVGSCSSVSMISEFATSKSLACGDYIDQRRQGLTSNTDGFTITSSNSSSTAYKAFDSITNSATSAWFSANSQYNTVGTYIGSTTTPRSNGESVAGEWITFIGSVNDINRHVFYPEFNNNLNVPVDLTLLYSINGGTSWIVAAAQNGIRWLTNKSYVINTETITSSFWRLVIQKTSGSAQGYAALGEWKMFKFTDGVQLVSQDNRLLVNAPADINGRLTAASHFIVDDRVTTTPFPLLAKQIYFQATAVSPGNDYNLSLPVAFQYQIVFNNVSGVTTGSTSGDFLPVSLTYNSQSGATGYQLTNSLYNGRVAKFSWTVTSSISGAGVSQFALLIQNGGVNTISNPTGYLNYESTVWKPSSFQQIVTLDISAIYSLVAFCTTPSKTKAVTFASLNIILI